MHVSELIQGENLGWRVALLSEVPEFELADGVHRQNLGGPQISRSMNCAAVCIFYQRLNRPINMLVPTRFTRLKKRPLPFKPAYDPNHSFLVGSEDDDSAVFAHCNDFRTAAHDAGTGSVVAGVTMCSRPELRN